eukprot:gene364-598_t
MNTGECDDGDDERGHGHQKAVFGTEPSSQEVLSAASLFFWTLTLIVLCKYVGIVLRFDDNGEGGTFALYSLICRAAGFGPYGALARGHFWSVQTGSGAVLRGWYGRSKVAQ